MKIIKLLIALIIILSSAGLLSSNGNGYLFRFKKVSLKYYASMDSVKIRNIDYQSLITNNIYYSQDRTINSTEIRIEKPNTFNDVTIQYPIKVTDLYVNSTAGSQEELTALEFTAIPKQDGFIKNQQISLNFNEPIGIPPKTRSIEYYTYSKLYSYSISLRFEAYNRNGYKVREFIQESNLTNPSRWLFNSFNLLADDSTPTISNLFLIGIDIDITGKVNKDGLSISISELISNSIVKHPDQSDQPAKRDYEDIEDWEAINKRWKLTHGIDPVELEQICNYSEHLPKDYGIDNGGRYYLELNPDVLTGYQHLLIDFSDDYFLPVDNVITILVRGRAMGEELSFIIEDGRGIYYELFAGYIDFDEWKALEIKVPTGFNLAYIEKGTSIPYVKLLGMRIGSGYDGKIGLYIDDISSIIDLNR
jgi:hypothetical protein